MISCICFSAYINKSASFESIANAERLHLKLIRLDVTDDSSVKALSFVLKGFDI
jgi:hypothetical protein